MPIENKCDMTNKNRWVLSLIFLSLTCLGSLEASFFDVSNSVFGTKNRNGVLSAFGDIDADKATDIFILSDDGKSVNILEADIDISRDGTKFHSKSFIKGKAEDATIVGLVPGDFNGDSQMDVLVMRRAGSDVSSSQVKIEIYAGNEPNSDPYLTINETFRDQPVIIDGDGDMSPDLFGELSNGSRALWTFKTNGSYTIDLYKNETGQALLPLKVPQSSAFLDLDGDLTADLCAVSETDGVVYFEFWLNRAGILTWSHSVAAPSQLKVVGQASFVDLDGNHETNIVLPGCLDIGCKESAIFVWEHNKYTSQSESGSWHKLDVNFKTDKGRVTSFPKNVNPTSWLSLPIVLRIGDSNLDGYPDALAVLTDSNGGTHNVSTFLMYNQGCSNCEGFSRTLSIDYSQPLQKNQPVVAAFFDLMENGVLDILLTEVTDDGKTLIRAVEQDFTGDASFLKVMVVSGLCFNDCPHGHSPYGVNQVGPTARFESTTPTGGDQIGVSSQLSQSAYFSLQLPFMLFGLGQTPNFVDEVQVGIPYPKGQSSRSHSWSSIIPNSQIIIIPYPVDRPSRWKHELYVTPSRLVLLTGVALLGTCAFISIIVGLLHWRERIEDKKEKIQESQRFHFDAM